MKTVLITGGSSGLGLELVRKFLNKGFRVVEISRSGIPSLSDNPNYIHFELDLRHLQLRITELKDVLDELSSLDVLINNAATHSDFEIEDISVKDIEDVFSINIIAPMLLTRLVIPYMITRQSGTIFNIGSIGIEQPWRGGALYLMSKSALKSFHKVLNLELNKSGIRSIFINPGWLLTPWGIEDGEARKTFIPSDEMKANALEPSYLADLIFFLATSQNRLHVDSILVKDINDEV